MPTVAIGTVELGKIPRIAGTVSSVETLDAIEARMPDYCDIVEFRLDLLPPIDDWRERLRRLAEKRIPAIVTIRSREEGGAWNGGETERERLYAEAAETAPAVDVELRSGICSAVIGLAKRHNAVSIASFHDFEKTPPLPVLLNIAAEAREAGASIAKIAAMVNDGEDISILEELAVRISRDAPVCVIGMGARGQATRYSLPEIGSALTYGYLDRSAAPGQMHCRELYARLRGHIQ